MKNLFLSEREKHQLLVEWNKHDFTYPSSLCIHQLFETQAELTPNKTAVVFENTRLTYEECNQQANQVARYLHSQGIGPEMTVGIYLEYSVTLLVAILGILKAGAGYVPIDPHHSSDRLLDVLQDTYISLFLTQASLKGKLPEATASIVCLDTDWTHIAQQNTTNPMPQGTPENLAFLLYTSGSTGIPKGVMITHANIVSTYFAWEKSYGLRSDASSFCQMANVAYMVFQADWVRALCSGGKLVLCSRETALTPHKLYHTMMQEQIDFAEFAPAGLRNLLRYLEETRQSLDFLHLLVIGSDRWYYHEHNQVQRFCGPSTRLIHSFGLTETTIASAYFEQTAASLAPGQLTPIGRPFPHAQLYVLDERFNPVPIGVVGHLCIGGIGLARGFLQNPTLTAQTFFPHPFPGEDGNKGAVKSRLYWTGDLARYLSDGVIQFLGRTDHQVKIRGFRVEIGEIEVALGQHASVGEVAVVAQEYTPGNTRLIAYVVPASQPLQLTNKYIDISPDQRDMALFHHMETHLSSGELSAFLKDKVPDYMLPAQFVFLNALPMTWNGKVNRHLLASGEPIHSQPERNPAEEIRPVTRESYRRSRRLPSSDDKDKVSDYMFPAQFGSSNALPMTSKGKANRHLLASGEPIHSQPERESIAPRNETEVILSQIWCAVLELDRVGIYDDFFHLGGHSLLATQVISRVCHTWNIELSVRNILRMRTISELAEEIDRLKKTGTVSKEEIKQVTRENYRRSRNLPLKMDDVVE